jgi:PTH1 family peptidyl-tRNA hydrolase
MVLIIGLGNPEEKYSDTRHNVGFKVVELFSNKNNFSDFRLEKKFNAKISEGLFNNEKLILAKPLTYMNRSGKSVKSLMFFFKEKRLQTIIVHDEIDLPLGKIKISKNRGTAGHKGIESIVAELKSKNFIRLRIGIAPTKRKKPAEVFVLERFSKNEKKILDDAISRSIQAIEYYLTYGLEKAMTEYNK